MITRIVDTVALNLSVAIVVVLSVKIVGTLVVLFGGERFLSI